MRLLYAPTNRGYCTALKNDDGFVLVAALACLVVLSLIGIASMNTAFIEKNISQNINLAEKTFYGADGGTEVGIEMLEWNLSCPLGFNKLGLNTPLQASVFANIGGIEIADPKFAHSETEVDIPGYVAPPTGADPLTGVPGNTIRSIRIADNLNVPFANRDNAGHTNLAIFGTTSLAPGSSVHMGAGYEGKGKGAAGGGGLINFGIFSQKLGILNSEAIIRLGWRHLIGSEGECSPY